MLQSSFDVKFVTEVTAEMAAAASVDTERDTESNGGERKVLESQIKKVGNRGNGGHPVNTGWVWAPSV